MRVRVPLERHNSWIQTSMHAHICYSYVFILCITYSLQFKDSVQVLVIRLRNRLIWKWKKITLHGWFAAWWLVALLSLFGSKVQHFHYAMLCNFWKPLWLTWRKGILLTKKGVGIKYQTVERLSGMGLPIRKYRRVPAICGLESG